MIQKPGIVKVHWYTKDPYEAKHQFLINIRKSAGLKHLNDSKAFIEYSNDMDDIYKSSNKKCKILIVLIIW